MSGTDVRDRTTEFKRVCASAQKRQNTPGGRRGLSCPLPRLLGLTMLVAVGPRSEANAPAQQNRVHDGRTGDRR